MVVAVLPLFAGGVDAQSMDAKEQQHHVLAQEPAPPQSHEDPRFLEECKAVYGTWGAVSVRTKEDMIGGRHGQGHTLEPKRPK